VDIGAVLGEMIRNGLKDAHLDILQVWRQIFARTGRSDGQGSLESFEAMAAFGDHGPVIAGVFENMHRQHDQFALQRTMFEDVGRSAVLDESVSLVDALQRFTFSFADGFQVQAYVPLVAAVAHIFCASAKSSVSWPKKDKEASHKAAQRDSILATLQASMARRARPVFVSKKTLVMDFVSPLLDIVSPRMRALPMITLSGPEQRTVMDAVGAMESVGLSFLASAAAEEQLLTKGRHKPAVSDSEPTLRLEPAIDLLTAFHCCGDSPALAGRYQTSAELRQILNFELRRFSITVKAESITIAPPSTAPQEPVPHTGENRAESIGKDQQFKRKHFFSASSCDLVSKKSKLGRPDHDSAKELKKGYVHFKFNQGYSNAVRRIVTIEEFI